MRFKPWLCPPLIGCLLLSAPRGYQLAVKVVHGGDQIGPVTDHAHDFMPFVGQDAGQFGRLFRCSGD